MTTYWHRHVHDHFQFHSGRQNTIFIFHPYSGGRTMGQSLSRVICHSVFSTKDRLPLLRPRLLRDALYGRMANLLNDMDCLPIRINGVDDHVHGLWCLSRNLPIKDIFRELKSHSSRWLKQQDPSLSRFAWQSGYGVFSVDYAGADHVTRYIDFQEEHHRTTSFQDELRHLAKLHGLEIDERYAWQ